MLSSSEEYRKMFETEEKLWWYRILHEKVLKTIQQIYQGNKEIKILDAGCGTGGMMQFLIQNGYNNIEGFDYSEDAVAFCLERKLNVKQIDITQLLSEYSENTYDIIINNDVLYQFENDDIKKIMTSLLTKLKIGGHLITNNQAHKIFYGTHDIAVGAKQRFTFSDFKKITSHFTNLQIIYSTYWSLFLSPIILLIRVIQQIKLKLKLIDTSEISSDVELPSPTVNNLLYRIVKFEEFSLKSSFFGSSLFLVFKKNN